MAVVNVTPDSFSDGGRFDSEDLVEVAKQMVLDGATILDIGGESTGPGSRDVSLEEELLRVVPAIRAVRAALPDVIISVDTWKSEVARAALEAGAGMINDVTAGRGDARIFEVAAEFNVPIVLMYSKDDSARTTADKVEYEDVMATVVDFLTERVAAARAVGVSEIIVDPGMGAFVSGDPAYSWEIIDRIEELGDLGCSVLVGASRKSFLGEDRFGGTLYTSALLKGRIDILRVHTVLENATVTLQ
ncbi:dihydropteroate synthase [Candidatus Peregrinibacteria bacterium]|nr:dihydropteroate synthase [Candidatus Peregrinibacteria bacterium]